MAQAINSLNCIVSEYGTGLRDCLLNPSQLEGVIKVPLNWSLTLESENFDSLAYIREEQQKGNFVPFLESVDFTDNTGENVYQEFTLGDEAFVRSPNPKFMLMYQKGMYFSKVAHSHKSGRCGLIFVFKNNTFAFKASKDGTKILPFTANHFTPTNYKLKNGTETDIVSIDMQLRNPDEWNEDMVLIEPSTFDYEDINGKIDVDITIPTPPINAATTIDVRVQAKWNPEDAIGVYTVNDFKITGKTVNSSSYNAETELFTLTIAETFDTGDNYKVFLNDGTYNSVEVEEEIYQGSSIQQVVAAS